MNKDVIYIDIEDDITAIIGKVKAAGTKIVALVPPKRIGALQSAVNLKLLQRAAGSADKRIVLITNDHSLLALAAGLKLPVAKNLQSRPEIPQMAMPEAPEEEVINGQELPVGEIEKSLSSTASKTAPATTSASAADAIASKVDITDATKEPPKPDPKKMPAASKLNKGSRLSIPNFDTFRKRIFVLGGAGVLLIAFLVWAIAFAPHATVTIAAKTTAVNIDRTLTLKPSAQASDPNNLTLKPVVQQLKKSVATEFTATGTKDIGEKAKGTITVSNGSSSDGVTLPAGTVFVSAAGPKFTSNTSVTVPGAKVVLGSIQPGTASVAVTASDIGPDYNLDSQGYSVQGYSGLGASGQAMSGGSKQTVTVVSQEDVDKAKAQVATQNITEAKNELKKQLTGDVLVIEESFTSETAAPSVSPNVGEQAKTAKLTNETTYTYVALQRSEVKTILTNAVNDVIKDKNDQQVYSLGENKIVFQSFEKADGGSFKAHMLTAGAVGPKIDAKQLAKQLVGKRSGEIQALIMAIPGVNDVLVQFSPFWVTTAPGADKIEIKFSVAPNS
ncbi:MAG TPA: hypothetical protein VLA88_06040 [Candidatus Saccharimonadales bacterium]|nr:hypothetical protein [Candidatus Saccharimonadales bacterium]